VNPRQIGLSADDFLRSLSQTHNSAVLGADIDRVRLDRILGLSDFFSVSEQRFDEIASIKGVRVQACFTRDQNGELEYSEKYTSMLKDWMASRTSGAMEPKEIFGIESSKVKCSGTAYLECGDKRLDLVHAYVIDDTVAANA
jgi:hypothetical protein